MRHHPANEIEIKLAVADAGAMRRRLRELGARAGRAVHEANLLFDTPDGSLRSREVLLRVRVERPARRSTPSSTREERVAALEEWMFPARGSQRAIITFKGPPLGGNAAQLTGKQPDSPGASGYKIRREVEFEVSDSVRFRELLAALGYRPAFYYEKLRTTYRLRRIRDLVISLDETPAGNYLELEGPIRAIDRGRAALGYKPEDAILLSYGALFAAHRRAAGLPMTDMLFAKRL